MTSELCQELADALRELVWSESPAHPPPADLRVKDLAKAAGLSLEEVLAEQADETLALALQKGVYPEAAFEELLVHRYERPLRRWLYRHTRDWHAAEDLTQQVFVRVWTRIGKYDPKRHFRAWLWTVAHHLWVEEGRRPWNRKLAVADLTQLNGGPSPDQEAAYRELVARSKAALAALPEPQQAILRGTMEGQDADALADQLGLAKSQVYQLLFRARRTMEQLLGLTPRLARSRRASGAGSAVAEQRAEE